MSSNISCEYFSFDPNACIFCEDSNELIDEIIDQFSEAISRGSNPKQIYSCVLNKEEEINSVVIALESRILGLQGLCLLKYTIRHLSFNHNGSVYKVDIDSQSKSQALLDLI